MKYFDGNNILLGDTIGLGGGMQGVVVACIEENEFSPEFSKEQWSYLKKGILVNSEQAGIIHYLKSCVDLILLHRNRYKT